MNLSIYIYFVDVDGKRRWGVEDGFIGQNCAAAEAVKCKGKPNDLNHEYSWLSAFMVKLLALSRFSLYLFALGRTGCTVT